MVRYEVEGGGFLALDKEVMGSVTNWTLHVEFCVGFPPSNQPQVRETRLDRRSNASRTPNPVNCLFVSFELGNSRKVFNRSQARLLQDVRHEQCGFVLTMR